MHPKRVETSVLTERGSGQPQHAPKRSQDHRREDQEASEGEHQNAKHSVSVKAAARYGFYAKSHYVTAHAGGQANRAHCDES